MKEIKHKELPVDQWGWINSDKCPCHDTFAHYLWMAAPQIDWYYVETVGSYQGDVYALGKYKGKIFVMKDYYGSCSGCGAWGEGGEPDKLRNVLTNGELYKTKEEAISISHKLFDNQYGQPTKKFWRKLNSL